VQLSPQITSQLVRRRVDLGVATLATGPDGAGIGFAQAATHALATGYWNAAVSLAGGQPAGLQPLPWQADAISGDAGRRLGALGAELAALCVEDAIAEIGRVYTQLLPPAHRKTNGIYYTPTALTRLLLDDATAAGMDWGRGKVISPSCGGGAFLVEDARRMAAAMTEADPASVISSIGVRLRGWDIDPFACWLSQLAVESVLLPLMIASRQRLPRITECRDALTVPLGAHEGAYDLANDNPPFGKIKDHPAMRAKFARSLRGHPNSYGMFTDLCIRLAIPSGGIIAILTPTSWLAGNYFAALRRTLHDHARPASVALVHSRKDIFDDVLQEVSLSCFVTGRLAGSAACSVIHIDPTETWRDDTGSLVLPINPEEPWLMPRHADDAALVTGMRALPFRLRDYGYTVSTGPLVWNRAAKLGRMHDVPGRLRVPVCWSEAVSQDGKFLGLTPQKRGHAAFYEPRPGNDPNVVTKTCILVQRTTAKEQRRRLISAVLPQSVIDAAGGKVAVENHLNMILPMSKRQAVPIQVLAAFLATPTADRVLRCINASVAVSATELEALPLPAPDDLIAALASEAPDAALQRLYGIKKTHGKSLSKARSGRLEFAAPPEAAARR
jgi:adenine-specific DNA-methyltransferase